MTSRPSRKSSKIVNITEKWKSVVLTEEQQAQVKRDMLRIRLRNDPDKLNDYYTLSLKALNARHLDHMTCPIYQAIYACKIIQLKQKIELEQRVQRDLKDIINRADTQID